MLEFKKASAEFYGDRIMYNLCMCVCVWGGGGGGQNKIALRHDSAKNWIRK